MKYILRNEQEMTDFGANLAKHLSCNILELIGDVGSGKTTITRGIARAFGVSEAVTSPSFTISKVYSTTKSLPNLPAITTLVHYDFYRLSDPGLMQEDLAENLDDSSVFTIIEWGASVSGLLPENHLQIHISTNSDGSRTIELPNEYQINLNHEDSQ